MLKFPQHYSGGKIRTVETIAKLISDFDEFRVPFLDGGLIFVRTHDLKSRIFVTAGKRSVRGNAGTAQWENGMNDRKKVID